MRDKSHSDFVERWAEFVKSNPDKWRDYHNKFINSQFKMHQEFMKKLSKQKGGKEKIIKLYNIKNKSALPNLFNS